jgi:two-component system response regulator CpxR
LVCLVRLAGTVVSRDTLANTALGRPLGMFDRSVDNHVSNLRKKLGLSASGEERIRNVRGSGYMYLGEIENATVEVEGPA